MQDQPAPKDSNSVPPTTAEEDAKIERHVLYAVLAAYPEIYAKDELAREISDDPRDFGVCDAIERIVLELSTLGLLHTFGSLVIPTRGALRFYRLSDG